MFLDFAARIGLFTMGLPVALGGAALGAWCAGFACRYACLLNGFFNRIAVRASVTPGNAGTGKMGPENIGSASMDPENTGLETPESGDGEGYSLLIKALACRSPSMFHCRQQGGGALKYGGAALMAPAVFLLWHQYGFGLAFWGTSAGAALLLALAIVDAKTLLLPDTLTLPLLWLGLALAWAGGQLPLRDAVAGAMAGYLFLWLLFWLFKYASKRDGMGYGDFKLFAALGAWVGWPGLPHVLLAACLGGILFACLSQKTILPRGAYPFGPFLALGGVGSLSFESAVQSCFG